MSDRGPKVAVIGGGLAGLSAALALAENGCQVELFESKRNLGGRAGSFVDKATGETIDHCQHVAMGCCTNYLDFSRRVGAFSSLRRVEVLHFIGPGGRGCDFHPPRWLPAPLHLAAALMRLSFLTFREQISIARALDRLAKLRGDMTGTCVGQWLRDQGQSPRQIDMFWSVVLVSALGEEIERASLAAARKVFVDGFMAARTAYEVYIPNAPLTTLYDSFVAGTLTQLGVTIHRESHIERIIGTASRVNEMVLRDGTTRAFDHYVLAVPWQIAARILDERLLAAMPDLTQISRMPGAPISAVHLWFDAPIMPHDHAILVGRLSQWVFARSQQAPAEKVDPASHYYQVVISASRNLAGQSADAIVATVETDLRAIFPKSRNAKLVRARVVTDRDAVFTPTAEWEALRPTQVTAIANLFLCGDWTATGWPATMESAVRSGRLAAEAVLAAARPAATYSSLLTPDLPRGSLARWLIK